MNLQPKLTASATLQSVAGGVLAIQPLPAPLSLALAPFYRGDPGAAGDLVEIVGNITTGTLDLSSGTVFVDAPAVSTTYAFAELPTVSAAYGFTLTVAPSATVTITWPLTVRWPAGAAPASPDSGATSVFVFFTADGGAVWYGFLAGEGMS